MKRGGFIIYKATNVVTGKSYIGQTSKKLDERIKSHIKDCYYHADNNYFYNSMRKYGVNAFEWEILDNCESKEKLNEMEKYYIKSLNTKKPYGYNLTNGGEGVVGYHHTNETKQKLSLLSRGENHWNYGKKWNEEVKKKNSETQKGRQISKERRDKISKGLKGKYIGRKISDDAKEKMSKAKTGLYNGKRNPNSKKYKLMNLETNEIIMIECLKEWCKKYNVKYDSIRVCVDKRPYKKIYVIEKCLEVCV